MYDSRSSMIAAPEPNPLFSFPMLPTEDSTKNSQENESDLAPKRTTNRSRPQHISISSTNPSSVFSFPVPHTPPAVEPVANSPSKSMSRTGGHRRGGSEFIGGEGPGLGLISTSPVNGDVAMPSPPLSGRRRGHAHRRSGAISNNDPTTVLKPGENRFSGSAPATPSDVNPRNQFISSPELAASQTTTSQSTSSAPASPESSRRSSPPTVQNRPRVGFSDTLEYIPRPLSTISSATSSTLSTLRPSHSLSGSVTSLRSSGTCSPPPAARDDQHVENLSSESPPRTVSSDTATSLFGNPLCRPSTPSSSSKPSMDEVIYEDESERSDLFFNPTSEPPAQDSPIEQTASTNASFRFQADLRALRGPYDPSGSHLTRPRSSPETKVSKRLKKGKSWSGLLLRKGKHRGLEQRLTESPSPASLREFAPLEDFPLEDVNFDEDTTCVIRTPGFDVPYSAPVMNSTTWKPSGLSDHDKNDAVLDLDATWEGMEIEEQANESGFSSAKRRMHSSGATGGFIGPGMHYHRRAESAPVMTPTQISLGVHRLGSNPQMADVFEEDEEEVIAAHGSRRESSQANRSQQIEPPGLDVQVVNVGGENIVPFDRSSKREPLNKTKSESGLGSKARQHDTDISHPSGETKDVQVGIANPGDEPRLSVVTKSSDESTVTPLSNDQSRNEATPIDPNHSQAAPQTFIAGAESPTDPSPDYIQTSFDVPRLNTAHSSITDRSVWSSSRTAESGPDTSYSTEDVPSLTSSASTMFSHAVPFSPVVESRPSAERSFSTSAVVSKRPGTASAAKRASLASLSRLVGGSFGEKSKLSIESSVPQEEGERRDKKKRNRISRLMKFWKSKENLRE